MDTDNRDRRPGPRFGAAWDALVHGKQVSDPKDALSATVAKANADNDAATQAILAKLGNEVGLQAAVNRVDSELDLQASIRGLIAARDRQLGELHRDLLAPRLERLRSAAAENDLEELRHQIGQLEESIGGMVRSLGAKWP